MKRIKKSIRTLIAGVEHDNAEYIKQAGGLKEYLLSNLNEDSDYWWFLADDNDDKLTEADRELVKSFINNL